VWHVDDGSFFPLAFFLDSAFSFDAWELVRRLALLT
jgi:hypothetical protein